MRTATTCRWRAAASQSSFSRTVRSRSHAKTHTPRTERSDVQMQAAARRDDGARNVRYSTAAGPPPGHAATAVSVEMKIRRRAMPVGGARLQFRKLWPCGNRQASRRRAAAACRASYVTCRCAISGCCAVGASTSSGAAAATSTPASILPVRKYQTRSAIWRLC